MSNFNAKHNRFGWMDIPVKDAARAAAFFEGVMAITVEKMEHEGMAFYVLEHDEGNGGCLVPDPDAVTSDKGPLVYLNVDGRIRDAIAKVTQLGGVVTEPIQSLGPYGFRALITDSEGNRFALHSNTDA